MSKYAIRICGDERGTDDRGDCPNPLHDWPLPIGYMAAEARLRARWANPRCPDCGIYGWLPAGRTTDSCRAVHVPYQQKPETTL